METALRPAPAPYEPFFSGGASDAAYASAMGIPVICASGPVVDFQHTRRERVLKASMAERAKVHTKVIVELPDDFGTQG